MSIGISCFIYWGDVVLGSQLEFPALFIGEVVLGRSGQMDPVLHLYNAILFYH